MHLKYAKMLVIVVHKNMELGDNTLNNERLSLVNTKFVKKYCEILIILVSLYMYTVSKLLHFVLNFQQTRNGSYMYMVGVVSHWVQTDIHIHVSQVSVTESLLNAFKE